jgi:glycosyltransferase involved in cell wall biosynthesis/GT2 family glycosyltransferase
MIRSQRICLLTSDFVGPVRNGGIGTAFLACAERFRDAGHHVTVLFPPDYTETLPLAHWRHHYAARGIDFVPLHAPPAERIVAFDAYQWLKTRDFDAIHFHEMRGIGYWLTVAKRCGLAFRDTALVCQLHSPTLWHRNHSAEFLDDLGLLELDWMERRSAEGADVAAAPSRYLLEEVARMGWRLPAGGQVLPNMLPADFPCAARPEGPLPIEELVFFGRLETRKGLDLFCQAVTRLEAQGRAPRRVSFLGKVGQMETGHALAWLAEAAGGWRTPWRVVNDRDATGARAFLAEPGRLAVIASRIENAPYAVLECLAAGLPFLAPAVGGIPELIAREDHAAVLYPRGVAGLAQAMAAALEGGARAARAAVTPEEAQAAWTGFQAELRVPPAAPALVSREPLVSVCMATHERVEPLAHAIASVEAQSHARVELVVVDDAGRDPAARAFLDALAPRFAVRGWQLLRNETNLFHGASRRRAVAAARGELLLLMDDDNIAAPRAVELFLTALHHRGADILTCQAQPFAGAGAPPPLVATRPAWMPIGPSAAAGTFLNTLGDTNMFLRRAAWEQLGGFTEDRCNFEDWEFLQAAVLAGLTVECLPEILYGYRVWSPAQTGAQSPEMLLASHRRAARPTLAAVPGPLRDAVRFAIETHVAGMRVRREGYWRDAAVPAPEQAAINRLPPNGAEAMLALAEAVAEMGQRRSARLLAEQALRLAPGHPGARAFLAERGGRDAGSG